MDLNRKAIWTKDLACLRGVKLAALNIRSMNNKKDDLEILLNQSKLDYLGLCESWLTEDTDTQVLQVPNYDTYRLDRTCESGKKVEGD